MSSSVFSYWNLLKIECGKAWSPPPQCKEYHTGKAGTVKSWNFDDSNNIHNNNLAYSICIRREKGYCGYSVVPADEPFRLRDIIMETCFMEVFKFSVLSGIRWQEGEMVDGFAEKTRSAFPNPLPLDEESQPKDIVEANYLLLI